MRNLAKGNLPARRPYQGQETTPRKDCPMLMTIALILFVLWLLGVVVFKVTGAFIHIVLIAAVIIGLVQLFRGRRV